MTDENKVAEEVKEADASQTSEEGKKAETKKKSEEKPLGKMTVKELKEIAKEISELTGVHGMNKPDLLTAIKKSRGIEEPKKKKDVSLFETKKKIRLLKAKRQEAIISKDKKMVMIYKRKISRLKKKTRHAA